MGIGIALGIICFALIVVFAVIVSSRGAVRAGAYGRRRGSWWSDAGDSSAGGGCGGGASCGGGGGCGGGS